jgi:hypothetical protein
MTKNTFFYEGGHNNAYNNDGERERESSIRWKVCSPKSVIQA